ncbi:branched-chain amino acid transport system II carrier protein [Sporosarcina sp. FA9]|uniref:branched-chain amino acid transport system II carrier protein n=1 Tax=Sporosarcina sp. FA9 TaxID=3413030 RepID=UPI003F65EFB4
MSFKKNVVIGLMLFALFLGAGNIIFPPLLGQMAGENLFIAMVGFLITGVGLPLLAVISIANAGGGLQTIAGRVHPLFGILFTLILYITIGPFFGIPRTATVSYEIAVIPFLTEGLLDAKWILFVFTIFFFIITTVVALNPAKLVDRIGKILTPILFTVIAALALKSVFTPMGTFGSAKDAYETQPFFRSFIEGYLTMDVLAALVFAIVIINVLRDEGITKRGPVLKAMTIAGLIAAAGLSFVYISLGYIGASSIDVIGLQNNGGAVLALASKVLYGSSGTAILAVTIIFACLTTSIGLVSACAQYINEVFPKYSYKTYVFIIAGFSALISNVGLAKLISISLPVLMMIYPLAIVLMLLSFIDKLFDRKPIVYSLALIATAIVSVFDGLSNADIHFATVDSILSYLPLYEQQIGWIVPAIVGALIGIAIAFFTKKS